MQESVSHRKESVEFSFQFAKVVMDILRERVLLSFKPFVANRIGDIQCTSPKQWRHVPGMENPPDLPTRGLSAADFCESKF